MNKKNARLLKKIMQRNNIHRNMEKIRRRILQYKRNHKFVTMKQYGLKYTTKRGMNIYDAFTAENYQEARKLARKKMREYDGTTWEQCKEVILKRLK